MKDEVVTHYCVGICFQIIPKSGKFGIIGVTSENWPREVKMPGGTNKEYLSESPEETLVRTFKKETGLTPLKYGLVCVDGRDPRHKKFFFVITSVEGTFDGPKTWEEADGEKLSVKLWELGKFGKRLFQTHRRAFFSACKVLIQKLPEFNVNHPDVCARVKHYFREF